MKSFIFLAVICIWCSIGGLGVLRNISSNNRGVNYAMLFFLSFMPCIPIVAHICGIY